MPDWVDKGSAIASHEVGLVIVGANHVIRGRKSSVLNFNGKVQVRLPELPSAMRASSVLYWDSFVYVIGGTRYTGNADDDVCLYSHWS